MATAETSPEKSTPADSSGRSGSGGGGAADSYIGSLISLTSKSEIRYEGVLYTINTEESSIGLRNVRSFGTEGRKKDGPQIPASDKIYEYILFRGSDIKDLQVKSPVQPVQPAQIHNDPAIIQSHYTRPSPAPGPTPDLTHPSQFSAGNLQQRPSPFQPNMPPLYQPNSSLPSWAPQPMGPQPNQPTPPVYWQGYYPPPPPTGGFQLPPHNQPTPGGFQLNQNQTPPTGGFQLPPPQNQQSPAGGFQLPPQNQPPAGGFQLPALNNQLPAGGFQLPHNHSLVMPLQFPPNLTAPNLTTMNLPELPPLLQQHSSNNTGTGTGTSNLNLSSNVPASVPVLTSSVSGFSAPFLANSLSLGSSGESSASVTSLSSNKLVVPVSTIETSVPLVTPGQLIPSSQTVPAPLSSVPVQSSPEIEREIKQPEISNNKSENKVAESKKSYENDPILDQVDDFEFKKDEIKKDESKKNEPILGDPPVQVNEIKEPLLPSPAPNSYRSGGGHSYNNHHNYNNNYRGRGRGRGPSAFSRGVTKFTEEFDFIAMNEKFNKDEVWGHLGKNKDENELNDETLDNDDQSETTQKPVYVKDDFFDSLSCTSLDRDSRNGRPRFSEQMKLDTETFGNFPRHHRPMGMRGGGGRGPRGGYNNNYNNNNNRGGYGYNNYNNNRGGYGYNNNNGNNPGRGTRRPIYNNNNSNDSNNNNNNNGIGNSASYERS